MLTGQEEDDDGSETLKTGFLHAKDRLTGEWRKVPDVAHLILESLRPDRKEAELC